MNRLAQCSETGDGDSDLEDPEQLLNEWLGELDTLTGVSNEHSKFTHFPFADTNEFKGT